MSPQTESPGTDLNQQLIQTQGKLNIIAEFEKAIQQCEMEGHCDATNKNIQHYLSSDLLDMNKAENIKKLVSETPLVYSIFKDISENTEKVNEILTAFDANNIHVKLAPAYGIIPIKIIMRFLRL